MKKDDKILEQQIGGLGGDPAETPVEEKPTSLGKIRVPGHQPDLTDEERESLDAFNRKSSKVLTLNRNNDIANGWIPIDRSEMGVRSQFYPEDWQFRVKPATVEAIKNWSSIDEENLAVTNNVFNEIIRNCVSIYSESTGNISWNKLNSWDRFWFILKVREYTFVKGEAALKYDEECDNCGASILYELKSSQLYYEFPDNDVIDNYWNADDRVWEINPRDFDVDYPALKLYTPTLEKDEAILQWAYAQQQGGKRMSEPFLRFLPWMLDRAPKDPSLLDRKIKECRTQFNNWDVEMFNFMEEVLRNITINPSEKLTQKCPHCGEEVRTAVQFPNGIKYLFTVESKHRKFGSK